MNKLKKNLEEYIKSGMWQYEAPYIGKDDVELILKVFNALDKACELLESATEYGQLPCPCEYLGICHCVNTESGYECSGDVDYKWKDALMKDE